ncbi:HK97 family phage prohead protease [Aquabacter spiritensis]|uniref:Prohead peptidase n=1 Tax=Aquabacter spiritensis TaxID=933073 RepID=A0A4R3M3N3_9HYPH|nr:HK97 family phage prohead protease [Aquabacter spiritensis]TCT07632.1 prohead peptidase [Aquabacter spiritensis]
MALAGFSGAQDGRIEGYACLFETVDLGRDVVARGAFSASLAARGAAGVRLLYQHDPAEPIGVWTHLAEDGRGLYVRGRLLLDVTRGREVMSLVRDGALDGLSIGFKAVQARTDPRSRVRRLLRIDLWEVSIVTFPMQPDARIAPAFSALVPSPSPTSRTPHDPAFRSPRDQGDRAGRRLAP